MGLASVSIEQGKWRVMPTIPAHPTDENQIIRRVISMHWFKSGSVRQQLRDLDSTFGMRVG